jgi:hypothetical protein
MKPFRFFPHIFTTLALSLSWSCNDDETVPVPEVITIIPASGQPNTLVAISGRFFHPVFSENKVRFNGKDALVTNATASQLNVLVPPNAETGAITVTVNGETAVNQPTFTVNPFPTVASNISPRTGRFGTEVTISGSNFLTPASLNVVSFNGVQAMVTSASTSSLTVTVPERAGSGLVVVNGASSGIAFTYKPDVFLGGNEFVSVNSYLAKVWTNGKATTLPSSHQYESCEDLFVVNGDVHAVGFRSNGTQFIAKYWKNNVEVPLVLGNKNSNARAVTVVGNDVYIAGSETNAGNFSVAKYWKNGEPVVLSDGKQNAYATGIAVNGSDVYVSGYVHDGIGLPSALYWKNGVAFPLTSGTNHTDAFAVMIAGNDVYIAGSDWGTGGNARACFWKNGVFVPVSGGAAVSFATDIAVVGDDVYVAGSEFNAANKLVGKYWKNGNPTILTDGTNSPAISKIDAIGDDVYVGGGEINSAGVNIAKYWKNGVPVIVSDGSNHGVVMALTLR